MEEKPSYGHYAALFSIIVWGTTFVSTKVLLESFLPIEILFFRFVLGFIALILLCPHRLKGTTVKQEITFVLAGLSGVTLYYLCENIALTYTMATNVSVIVAAAPLFTALLNKLTKDGKEKTSKLFYLGFIIAMAGICLISFNGSRLSNTRKVKRFHKIVVMPECKNVIRELHDLTYARDAKGETKYDEFNIDPHTFSAIWYALDTVTVADVKDRQFYSKKGD